MFQTVEIIRGVLTRCFSLPVAVCLGWLWAGSALTGTSVIPPNILKELLPPKT